MLALVVALRLLAWRALSYDRRVGGCPIAEASLVAGCVVIHLAVAFRDAMWPCSGTDR